MSEGKKKFREGVRNTGFKPEKPTSPPDLSVTPIPPPVPNSPTPIFKRTESSSDGEKDEST